MKRFIPALLLLVLSAQAHAQVITGGAVTGTSLNVRTLSTGTVLQVAPAVSSDGRYVTMSINPQFSTLDGVDTFVVANGPGTIGGAGGGGGFGGMPQPVAIRRLPFRPAQIGKVVFVDNDKPLLAAKVPAAAWKSITLKAAMRNLADLTRQNIVLGNRGLEQAGVDLNATHDFAFAAGTVKDALLALLQTALPGKEMVISSEDKVIQVITQSQADQVLVSKTYYLEDLLAALPRFVRGGTDLNEIGSGAVSQYEDLSRPLDLSKAPEHAARKPAAAPRAADSTNILEVITDTVRPEIWRNHGGKSEIAMVGNRVTIKAPASVHALLDGPKVFNPGKVPVYVNYQQ
jgi:hypothetical protein